MYYDHVVNIVEVSQLPTNVSKSRNMHYDHVVDTVYLTKLNTSVSRQEKQAL